MFIDDYSISISISISILLFRHGSPSGKRPDLQGAMLKKKYSSIILTSCDTIFDLDCRWLLQTFGKCPALPHWRHFFSVAGQGLLFGKGPFTTLVAFCLCGGARLLL